MIRRVYEFTCDNCNRRIIIGGGAAFAAGLPLAKTAKAAATRVRELGWSVGRRDLCERCHRQGDAT